MKSVVGHISQHGGSRSPCGERGLKCDEVDGDRYKHIVAPRAGSVG